MSHPASETSALKILVRLPNWLGDVVMSSAFIEALLRVFPGAIADVIVKKELSDIPSLIKGVNQIFPFSKQEYSGIQGAYRFGKQFRSNEYDLFFNLPASSSSMVMAKAAKAKKRIGFAEEGGRFLLTNSYRRPGGVHRADEYVWLLEQFTGQTIDERTVKLSLNQKTGKDPERLLINFNSEASSRRMPVDKARAIINLLTRTFKDITFTFIGSPKESAFVEEVIERAVNRDRIQNMAGKTDLTSLSRLMASSAGLLSTDSGPAHLANGLGVPVVALFGAGNEYNTAPYNKQDLTIIRDGKLDCEPCVRNECKLYGVPKCMQMIDDMQIVTALSNFLPMDTPK